MKQKFSKMVIEALRKEIKRLLVFHSGTQYYLINTAHVPSSVEEGELLVDKFGKMLFCSAMLFKDKESVLPGMEA